MPTAGGVAAVLALVLGGCNGLPIGRVAPVANRPRTTLGKMGRATLLPATVALDVPSEMAAIDPSNSSRGTVTPAAAIGSSPRTDLISTEAPAPLPPTPLLDAALVQARSRGEVVDPAEPTAIPDLPQPAPALPPAAPEPEVVVNPTPPPVVVAPSPAVADPRPTEASPVPPEEAWRDGVRKLVGLARSRQEQANAAGATEPWGLRARVLAWLAEPDIDPDLGQRDADTVRAVLRALQATTSAGDPRADTHTRGDDVRTAVQTLEAKAPLELVDLRLCSKVERFGDFSLFDPPARRAGDWVVIYAEVDGLHHEQTSKGFQSRLAGRMEIIPAAGGPSIALPLDTADDLFPRRRRDYYIAYLKELPANLAPGHYTLRLTLQDVFADRSATRGVPLTIVAEPEAVARTPQGAPASP